MSKEKIVEVVATGSIDICNAYLNLDFVFISVTESRAWVDAPKRIVKETDNHVAGWVESYWQYILGRPEAVEQVDDTALSNEIKACKENRFTRKQQCDRLRKQLAKSRTRERKAQNTDEER